MTPKSKSPAVPAQPPASPPSPPSPPSPAPAPRTPPPKVVTQRPGRFPSRVELGNDGAVVDTNPPTHTKPKK